MNANVAVKNVVDFLSADEDSIQFLNDEVSSDVFKANYDSIVTYDTCEITTDEFEVYVTFKDAATGADTFLAYIMSAFVACEFLLKFEGEDFFDSVDAG